MPEPADLAALRAEILAWYDHHQRALPWRDETSPYRIWVSEVMLQQTQVTTVIPYYHRFLARFPTLADLAQASQDEVLKQWEGLGYYARARNLHRAAQQLVADYNGHLPQTYRELRCLPGFGPYTAGAVASIAFGEPVAAVDGNVKRVLARLFAIKTDIRRSPATGQIQDLAQALVDPARPAAWTQALMELGATVCLPSRPKCLLCPVQARCKGQQQGIQNELPYKEAKAPIPHYNVTAAVIQQGAQMLIAQRPEDGMLGGLWEFPGGKQEPDESLPDCLRREIKEELGLDIVVGELLTTIKHAYTHFKITLYAYRCHLLTEATPQRLQVADWQWVTRSELAQFAFPRTDQKIIAVLDDD